MTGPGGAPAPDAVLLEIRRHVHPKTAAATRDTDPGAANAASGIDYLRLIEDRHKETMTGAPISYDKIAAAAEEQNPDQNAAQDPATSPAELAEGAR